MMVGKKWLAVLLVTIICLIGARSAATAQSTPTPAPPTPEPSATSVFSLLPASTAEASPTSIFNLMPASTAESTPEATASTDPILALLESANTHLTNGEYDKALEEYNQVLALDAKNYVAFYGVGDIEYHVLQDCDKAVDAYRSAIEFEPFTQRALDQAVPLAYAKIADCLAKSGDFSGAVDSLNHVAQLTDVSSDPQFYYVRGQYYLALGDKDSAANDYGAVLKLDPPGFTNYLYMKAGQDYQSGTPDDLHDALFHLTVLLQGMDSILASGSSDARGEAVEAMLLAGAVQEALGAHSNAAVAFIGYIALARQKPTSDAISVPTSTYSVEMHEGKVYNLTFEAHQGDVINISAIGRPFGKVDPLIVLVQPSGDPLIGNDDEDSKSLNSHIDDFTLPADGTYSLIVTHAGGGSEGDIRLIIQLKTDQ